MTPPADCRRCGVCCFSASPTFVRVTGDDWTRLGPDAEQFAQFVANRAYLRMTDGHCAALEIRRSGGTRDFFCSIYDRRPQACRDLARGSPECEGERELKSEAVAGSG